MAPQVIDLIAILPWYIEKLALMGSSGVPQQRGGFAVVRVVRLVRLLKLVRYGQRNKKMGGMLTVFRETMQESSSNLKMMIMFELLTMMICGADNQRFTRNLTKRQRSWLVTHCSL